MQAAPVRQQGVIGVHQKGVVELVGELPLQLAEAEKSTTKPCGSSRWARNQKMKLRL